MCGCVRACACEIEVLKVCVCAKEIERVSSWVKRVRQSEGVNAMSLCGKGGMTFYSHINAHQC